MFGVQNPMKLLASIALICLCGSAVGASEYSVHTYTGNRSYAGTDSDVYIVITGSDGSIGPIFLDNRANNFERDKDDYFSFDGPDIGNLKSVRIYHDNSGRYPGWFLERLSVQKSNPEGGIGQFGREVLVNRWLAADEPGGADRSGNESLNHQPCFDIDFSPSGNSYTLPMPCRAPETMRRPDPSAMPATEGTWFFFRMTSSNSWVSPCFTYAVLASSSDEARAWAESANGGYTATPIDYEAYIRGCS